MDIDIDELENECRKFMHRTPSKSEFLAVIKKLRDTEQERDQLRAQLKAAQNLDSYDAGYLNDFGGGNVSWWHDYIRSELGRAYDFYQSQLAAPVPAQQSPAVAVPDDDDYATKYMNLLSDVLDAKEIMRDAGVNHNVFSVMFSEYAKLLPSPRITEQDAREFSGSEFYLFRRKGLEPFLTCSRERFDELSINDSFETKILYEKALVSVPFPHPRISEDELKLIAKKYYDWCNSNEVFNRRTMLETWFNEEGRDLLAKLNHKPAESKCRRTGDIHVAEPSDVLPEFKS